MAKDATKKLKPKSGRKPAHSEVVWYVIAIEGWEWDFSFGINWRKEERDPYSDHRHLKVHGKLTRPAKMKGKEAEIVLVPSQDLNEGNREGRTPIAVGAFHFYRGKADAVFSAPSDVVPSLLTMLTADRFRYVVLEGKKAHYGRAEIARYSFYMSMTHDDLPPE